MTKPAVSPPARADVVEEIEIVEVEVVEIDAMDLAEWEWESGQRTPQASDANLAELVRQSAEPTAPVASNGGGSSSPDGRPSGRAKTATLVPARTPPAQLARTAPPAARPTPATTVASTRAPELPAEAARSPAAMTTGGIDFSLPVTATGAGDARSPEREPPAPSAMTAFAEPPRVGPGRISSPAGSVEPNTAWPPRPIPVEAPPTLERLAAPEVAAPPQATGDQAEGVGRLRGALTRRRLGWIAGTVGTLSLGVVLAAGLLHARGSSRAPAPSEGRVPGAARPASDVAAAAPAAAGAGAGTSVPRPAAAVPDAAATRGASTAPGRPIGVAAAAPTASASGHRPARHAAKRIAGKKLVVDYTARPSDPPPPSVVAQSEDDPAVGRARTAYAAGNQMLFTGNPDGAIHAYRRALELYPGYVGGYRGLGLAYMQAGDKASALSALRTYVAAVPNARDVALIKKRIAHLQRR